MNRPPVEVTVEIPSGSRNKYEYDHLRHRFVLGPYAVLEKRPTGVRGWLGVADAWRIIDAAMYAGTVPSEISPGTWR